MTRQQTGRPGAYAPGGEPDDPDDVALIRLPARLPDGQAVRPAFVGERTVTYGELAGEVVALAAALAELGAVPGDRVAVWTDKQPRYAGAVLAALRAGCAYVPLDGRQPPDRVGTILADAEPAVVFTDRTRLGPLAGAGLPASVRAVVLVDPEPDAGPDAGPAGTAPERGTAPVPVPVRTWDALTDRTAGRTAGPAPGRDDLAALLYTSGSTGTPKGVRITYRNLAAFIRWARAELALGPGDVLANHASFNFDLSTFDLFAGLSSGAAVWIVPDDRTRDVAALAAGVREHGVTVWYSVPSVLNLLTVSGALTPRATRTLRHVLFAGEVFPVPQLRALAALLPAETSLYNLYGPTETNVCTYHRVRPEDLANDRPVPIGGPLPGARLTVTGEDGRPAEGPGAIGELVVEGDCVTPGYWRRETESAAAGHHLGRHATGDLVSREDGGLVYRGRRDRMVKLSGYRVELGEIEAAALRHPAVETAAAVVAGGDDPRIALYYTVRDGADAPGLLALKRHCARHLPPYMLPRTAVRLAELPHNANGKTDYRRLADEAAEAAAAGRRPRALTGK
ncbi:amino acid adenylation domain-containing protein [Streptomyces sp. TRM 70361]|uniref:amino acid adenylation domain-containing protein n=1 Tax=Streptomyces sp. TRM 70361 TaxID=3116553 RepID=UPI002E7BCD30|nr:amino acid adenylation domain-containing protein [Streptomyces sp. TRM 70361]MEE1942544.1 amino acid adenylation domain-containing protein [Streptomyces sp. TRM 70361]